MIFDKFADGFEAIIRPANPNGFALRLRGKLLLGISRLHRAKVIQRNKAHYFPSVMYLSCFQVHYFSEDIQQTHDRISLSLKLGNGAAVDLQTGKKRARVEAITMNIDNDYDLHFEISDELPGWFLSIILDFRQMDRCQHL